MLGRVYEACMNCDAKQTKTTHAHSNMQYTQNIETKLHIYVFMIFDITKIACLVSHDE